MFDHVVFGVSDYAASKAFFLKALEPLGVAVVSEGPLGVELCRPNDKSSLCIRLILFRIQTYRCDPFESSQSLHLCGV